MGSAVVSNTTQALHLWVDQHGILSRCNDVAHDWLDALGCQLGRRAPGALQDLVTQAQTAGVVVGRLPCGGDQLDVVVVDHEKGCDIYGRDRPIDPDPFHLTRGNPNPVLRVSGEGRILYANPAAEPLLAGWSVRTGGTLPEAWVNAMRQVSPGDRRELIAGGGYAVTVCPQPESPSVYLYARKLD